MYTCVCVCTHGGISHIHNMRIAYGVVVDDDDDDNDEDYEHDVRSVGDAGCMLCAAFRVLGGGWRGEAMSDCASMQPAKLLQLYWDTWNVRRAADARAGGPGARSAGTG